MNFWFKLSALVFTLILIILYKLNFQNITSNMKIVQENNSTKKCINQIAPSTSFLKNCVNQAEKKFNKSIWTLLSNEIGYATSAIKLIKSIRVFTNKQFYDNFVLEIKERPLTDSVKQALINAGWKICTVNGLTRKKDQNKNKTIINFKKLLFTKFLLWNFTEYESIYYFDADTLVINDINEYLNLDNKLDSLSKIGISRDFFDGKYQNTFDSGLFFIKPNKNEFEILANQLIHGYLTEPQILTKIYGNEWYNITFQNNANLAIYSQLNEYWIEKEDSINILHFSVEKPWLCSEKYKNICQKWMKFSKLYSLI
jgi:alpha-N-acetylglucosamine transferase